VEPVREAVAGNGAVAADEERLDRVAGEVVELELADYEAVRSDPRCFVVAPGHDTPLDEVLRTGDGYAVVKKVDAVVAGLVRRLDPRAEPA
jgi:hypothetical protein